MCEQLVLFVNCTISKNSFTSLQNVGQKMIVVYHQSSLVLADLPETQSEP
jgi:hypothetical protein